MPSTAYDKATCSFTKQVVITVCVVDARLPYLLPKLVCSRLSSCSVINFIDVADILSHSCAAAA